MTSTEPPLATRRAGVLLHVTSLPDGDLGQGARDFVDFLAAAGCTVWQVLPLVPVHEDEGSPYNALSAMAGDTRLIDPTGRPQRLEAADEARFEDWCARQSSWLVPFAEFTVLRELQERRPWLEWEPGLRDRDPAAVADFLAPHADRVAEVRLEQWIFDEQWRALTEYAASRGVLLFGDLPIFVAPDSADVWADRALFELDRAGRPTTVTGVPPDYFAADGQRWNNPHYDWAAMAQDGFAWWRRRIARQCELFDLVRIDHFRGFEAAWHVPVEAATAKEGRWVEAPGDAVLSALVATAGEGTLVAEDLGVITDEVDALRERHALPGMKVLQFAFDGSEDNPYLPERHGVDAVVYTGTHDNDTTLGWWQEADATTRSEVARYVRAAPHGVEDMPWPMIELALASTAALAVVPAQDLLGLDTTARMNTPGVREGNWTWRAPRDGFTPELARRMRTLVAAAERLPG